MSSATRTSFYRELGAGLFSPARYVAFGSFFAISAAFLFAFLQLGEGKFWTISALWTLSVAFPLPLLSSLITMPMFAGERAAGTYESLALLPIPIRKIVIGKFIASLILSCLGILGAIVPWLVLCVVLGVNEIMPSFMTLSASLVILFLHVFSWTSLGTLCSALARRPWIAAAGTILVGGALLLFWAAFSRFFLSGNISSTPFPIWSELLDAAGGRIALHSVVFHLSFGLWCLFICVQYLEAKR